MSELSTTPKMLAGRPARILAAAFLVMLAAQGLTFNSLMERYGEDRAPIWNCYTMGNHRCGPDSPWHGTYIRSDIFSPSTWRLSGWPT